MASVAEVQEAPEGQADERRERLAAIVGRLAKDAEERVNKRRSIEERWLDDLRQFYGQYTDKIVTELKEANKSVLFINQTRPKTNACEARLSDMLFPTDDRNWGIGPTPVPELTVQAEEVAMEAAAAAAQLEQSPESAETQVRASKAMLAQAEIQAQLDEARKRARAMETEIEDHLRECRYQASARDAIRDACRLGTGIMKGPITGDKLRRQWQPGADGQHALQEIQDARPEFWRVDPWHFFPETDAQCMEDNGSTFERHLMKAKDLKKLARKSGFDANAIRTLLQDEPRAVMPQFIADLRSLTGGEVDTTTNRYEVWEYRGPLTAEEMLDIARMSGRDQMVEDLELEDEKVDPLQEMHAVVWLCQDQLLKFGIHHLDSGESIYSVFNLEKDESSIFGFGIPYLMRDSQKALSSAWRIMMDNAGLSSGPQIVVDTQVVEPVDGNYMLTPRKMWKKKSNVAPNARPFESFDIPMHQQELANIIEMAKTFIDDETSMPMIAQGEQGAQVTKTAQGMSLLMNSANVVFRRIVKNFDDDMTTPNIRRMYDFLMQFSQKDYIKGDFEVDARGTSVLLVREMQSANLMTFLLQFGAHPVLAKFLKKEGLPAMRLLVQTMMIPADEVVKTDQELEKDMAEAAKQPPAADPVIMELEARMNLAQMDGETKLQLAQLNRETELIKLAHTSNMDVEKLRTMLQMKQMDVDSKERVLATEVAVEQQQSRNGEADKGSGGYIS